MHTLQIRQLTIHHRRDLRCLIRDLSFTLREHDRAAIIGEEGNGKSTLLKLIYEPSLIESYCEVTGEIIRPGSIGYLEQELPKEKAGWTVYEFFCAMPEFYNRTPGELSRTAQKLGLTGDVYYSSLQKTLNNGTAVPSARCTEGNRLIQRFSQKSGYLVNPLLPLFCAPLFLEKAMVFS